MSTYLVTGAAGFIAAKVCELLLARGEVVVGIDNLNNYYDVRLKDHRLSRLLGISGWSPGSDANASCFSLPHYTNKRFHFFRMDVENQRDLDSIFLKFKFDAVINLAARAGVRYSIINPHAYITTNTLGTLNLLECQKKYGVSKHILASTSSLYAGSKTPFHESLSVNCPLSPYAASKKAAEVLAYTYYRLYSIDVSVVRYFTVFGPAGRPDMAPFRFIKWISEGIPIVIYGDGHQTRDFTFIDDIAEGTILALSQSGYEITNLGGGRSPVSLVQMINIIEGLVGRRATLDFKEANPSDMAETQANISKAKRQLAWFPKVTLEDGLKKTADWYAFNAKWVKMIAT